MATAREIRESQEQAHELRDLARLEDGLRASPHAYLLDEYPVERSGMGLVVGPVEVLAGLDPNKPVIRDSSTKRLLPGSGKYSGSKSIVQAHQEHADTTYREKVEYREAFERLFPAGGDADERGSMAWLFDQFWAAVEGSPQLVDCPHPEYHEDPKHHTPLKHVVAFKKDAASMFKMIELGVGRAAQTININKKEERLAILLEQRQFDVRVHGIEQEEVIAREQMLAGYGYKDVVDGEFKELDDAGTSDAERSEPLVGEGLGAEGTEHSGGSPTETPA